MGIFSSRNGDQMGTKCGPEKRIFDKLTKTSWFIEINEWSSAALWNALRTKNGIMWEKLNIRRGRLKLEVFQKFIPILVWKRPEFSELPRR